MNKLILTLIIANYFEYFFTLGIFKCGSLDANPINTPLVQKG